MPDHDQSTPDELRAIYDKLSKEAIKEDLQEFLSEDEEVFLEEVIREIKETLRAKETGGDAA